MKDNNLNKRNIRRLSIISVIWIILILLIVITIISIISNYFKFKRENEIAEIDINIPIPEGFYYVGGTKSTGFVISDDKNDYKKGVSYDSLRKLNGNQFVWVPVENPVAENQAQVKEMISENKYPIAIKNENGYEGLLYKFDEFEKKYYPVLDKIEIQEPMILSDKLYGDSEEYLTGSTQNLYQDTYNNMIRSVQKNKGFYISRFEAGNISSNYTDNLNIVSKSGQTDISYSSWFLMYKGISSMYKRDDITTEIIWGSQWDATLRWICDSNESFYNLSSKNGNFSGQKKETGSDSNYSLNNIYDLYGNVSEWTQSGARDGSRITKGANYLAYKSISNIEYFGVTYLHEQVGTRISMYIN